MVRTWVGPWSTWRVTGAISPVDETNWLAKAKRMAGAPATQATVNVAGSRPEGRAGMRRSELKTSSSLAAGAPVRNTPS